MCLYSDCITISVDQSTGVLATDDSTEVHSLVPAMESVAVADSVDTPKEISLHEKADMLVAYSSVGGKLSKLRVY